MLFFSYPIFSAPCRKFRKFCLLRGFYNGGLWRKIFWSIHKLVIRLTQQLYCTIIFYIRDSWATLELYPVYLRMALIFTDLLTGIQFNHVHCKKPVNINGRVGKSSDCRAGGQWFKSWHPTSAEICMWGRWLAAILAIIHWQRCCTIGESQGTYVMYTSAKCESRQNPLWLWNPEETSPEVQNRGFR